MFASGSPARQLLERLADRWSSMLVCALAAGPQRYGALRRQLSGISAKMLAQTLRRLERDGMVQRTVHNTRPPSVEYALTPLGVTVVQPLSEMLAWAERHHAEVEAARSAYDHLHDTATADGAATAHNASTPAAPTG